MTSCFSVFGKSVRLKYQNENDNLNFSSLFVFETRGGGGHHPQHLRWLMCVCVAYFPKNAVFPGEYAFLKESFPKEFFLALSETVSFLGNNYFSRGESGSGWHFIGAYLVSAVVAATGVWGVSKAFRKSR